MKHLVFLIFLSMMVSCTNNEKELKVKVFETSANGAKLSSKEQFALKGQPIEIKIDTSKQYQKITGFGGSFTESTAYLLQQLSPEKRQELLEAYFSKKGAAYSLTRTHINSCDFSLGQYAYATEAGGEELKDFSIDPDRDDIIPIIKQAMGISADGFKIISSPWTAPPWMKDNNDWVGGKLLPEYYDTWALYFSKYLAAYGEEGIDIWGLTVENEPLGNGNNWESMHFTPEEMTDFVAHHLGPQLAKDGYSHIKVLGYDQNRADLKEWVDEMYRDANASRYFGGTAIHWYESTFKVFPEQLQYAHQKAPEKHLIQTEACVDAEVPHWQDDAWYWSKEATDWGWDWAPEETKPWHPKYVPVYRYARDIIGCLNNRVDGWVDWNMVLDRQGGPNWFKNWCVAPVIVDPEMDEVYYTPIYYTMAHFSKFIRPASVVLDVQTSDDTLQVTAAKNPDGSLVVVILNESVHAKSYVLKLQGMQKELSIDAKAIQTVVLPPDI